MALGHLIWEDIQVLSPLEIDLSKAKSVLDWIESRSHKISGVVTRLVVDDVRLDQDFFDRLSIEGPVLSSSQLWETIWRSSSSFNSMKFTAPLAEGMRRQLVCTLDWRARLEYSIPDLQLDEVMPLIRDLAGVMVVTNH
jgi:hypothetical protein